MEEKASQSASFRAPYAMNFTPLGVDAATLK
jgi:hypothetical protein